MGSAKTPPARPGQRTSPVLRGLFINAALVVACLLAAHLLAGCGGGDHEPEQPTPSVNCALQPVLCT